MSRATRKPNPNTGDLEHLQKYQDVIKFNPETGEHNIPYDQLPPPSEEEMQVVRDRLYKFFVRTVNAMRDETDEDSEDVQTDYE